MKFFDVCFYDGGSEYNMTIAQNSFMLAQMEAKSLFLMMCNMWEHVRVTNNETGEIVIVL